MCVALVSPTTHLSHLLVVDEALPVPVHQCTNSAISSTHQCTCTQSTSAPVPVPAGRVARRARGQRGEGADLQRLGATGRLDPDQRVAIKETPPVMGWSPAVEVRPGPCTTIHTATGVVVLVLVNLSL